MAIFNELPISFPWYQRKEHQNRFKANVAGRPDLPGGYTAIDLICPYDAILPFQFYLPSPVNSSVSPVAWGIYKEDDSFVQAISLTQLVSSYLPGVNRKYFYHDGAQQNIHLGLGSYYCRIDFDNGFSEYSEVFHVCNFSITQLDCPFLKLEWYNDTDIDPVYYNDKRNGIPRFRNILYLDTFIHEYETTITVESDNDQDGKPIPRFTTGDMKYKIAIVGSGYLEKALVLAQMHDHIILTTSGIEHRIGQLDTYEVATEKLLNGAFSKIDITFEENYLTKKACGENMV